MGARASLRSRTPPDEAVPGTTRNPRQDSGKDAVVSSRMGLLVASTSLEFLYANAAATEILTFPQNSADPATVERRLKSIFPSERLDDHSEAAFISGRRRYVCRQFPLEIRSRPSPNPVIGLIIERPPSDDGGATSLRRRFHLSPREFESVQYLTQGLTTKEVASLMRVSPNTVKQYIRLVMSKMGVTTRAGIVGKFLAG
jgi:DNA-binding CsgD family transcriptional regulator